ncbi:lipopolysaccharide biosynthesis protein [Vibrio neonatus]|uniref:lipopolysaccharide biosynthesis protein n=1 Tax=Vibrio neonatus TaxID=278860 RepID=UPI0021C26E95|nr:oligosaccharide flippase family protein [Vibrio neonatus]
MIKKLTQSKFIRNVAVVATGAAGAQALTMLFTPIITRIYGAEQFGLLGVFLAILGVLSPIVALAYPIAIVLPRNDDDARGIARLSVFITGIISLLIFLIIFFTEKYLVNWFNLESISSFLILIPFAVFFIGLQQIMQQWLIRKKQFKITARIAISQALIVNSAKSGFGVLNPTGWVLILVAVLGNALYFLQLFWGANKWSVEEDKISKSPPSSVSMQKLAYKHRDFAFYRAPQQFINALSQSLPVLLLVSFFGPATAGFYTIGRTVLGIPSTLIGKAVGDVFYPRIAAAAYNNENLFNLIIKATLALAAVGFLPFFLIIVFGPWLFSMVFGPEWVVAGEYARWMAVWMYFMFINSPSNQAIPVLGIQRFYLFFTFLTILVRFLVLFMSFYFFKSDIISIASFSVVGAITNILIISIVLLYSRQYGKRKLKNG